MGPCQANAALALALVKSDATHALVGRVGKTSIVVRYCNDEFHEKQQSTIQASHLAKRVTIGETHVTLNVWVSWSELAWL